MSFLIHINTDDIFPVITLTNNTNTCSATIYATGALLNAFTITGPKGSTNIVDAFSSPQDALDNFTNGFKSAKLSPFVCRLNKGVYQYDGQQYTIEKHYLGDSAIHGIVYDAPYKIIHSGADETKAFVVLQYHYRGTDKGYPFQYVITVTYLLSRQHTLSITTSVSNIGNHAIPLADGWHPYFSLGATVNNLQLGFNSKEMVVFNEALIPTGAVEPYHVYNTPKLLGDTFFDNCFVLANTTEIACSLTDEQAGIQLNIMPNAAYPYLQIYTPPHRNSIAIENLSSVPDAFNNGIGLILAAPGSTHEFTTSYQVLAI
ncbi:aldose 1-epimerase [Limnovirga soli]|uniref:Aldose 1-epimerase n=1 Tax=Limnovirga soli TaxID=2656915 RepID=A0A8J8JZ51_9BACT|nr:aldose 1-epimerase [Limnovirga soli]NNV57981.1 aldose 1-epimerase [Limnovirga soli]